MGTLYFIGVGMGGLSTLTYEGLAAVNNADLLIGAPRLLETFAELNTEKLPIINPDEINSAVRKNEGKKIALLFSGDIGFYSGADKLYKLLADYDIVTLPGISSLPYLAARLRLSWQDVHCISAHGRDADCAGAVQQNHKTFILTGGKTSAQDVCEELTARGMGYVTVHIGENLSYPNERIISSSAEQLAIVSTKGLSAMLVINNKPIKRSYEAPFLKDEDFIRTKVPMTKEELRILCVSKLKLKQNHVLWDVGAGTGSVSVECALALSAGRVFAVEKKDEAVETLKLNKDKFGIYNMEIVHGSAPEALTGLPSPDRVFIGGSSGNLVDILKTALGKNPEVRFVITAVTLETLTEALKSIAELKLNEPEIVQINSSRAVKAGSYHMMSAQNPVWIIACEGSFDS